MLSIYLVAAIIGGSLVLLSAFAGGDHDGDLEHDAELGAEAEAHFDADEHDLEESLSTDAGVWLPFLSLRFWTYTSAFFGLTGTLLTWLSRAGAVTTALVAAGTGLAAGFGVSLAMRLLKKTQSTSSLSSRELVGADGRVLLPLRAHDAGKIRCEVNGEVIDLVAVTDGEETLEIGTEVVVVSFNDNRALVVPRCELLPPGSGDALDLDDEASRIARGGAS